MTVASYVRGLWEARAVRLEQVDPQATALRVGGWATPVSDTADVPLVSRVELLDLPALPWLQNQADSPLVSLIERLDLPVTPGFLSHTDSPLLALVETQARTDASPLGASTVTYLDLPLLIGQWMTVLITLARSATHKATPPPVNFRGNNHSRRKQ
ncbi:MAG: hypothetical protein LBV00_07690 [Propionibacteriaceae bacterium]|nr:hypothetical protein [Propionibacteriaceae bacterium]